VSIRIPWTDRHTEVAIKMAAEGKPYRLISERLGHPEHIIGNRIRKARKEQEKAASHD
jgi:hypothetical protein